MTDKREAIDSLKLASDTCNAALSTLSQSKDLVTSPSQVQLTILRQDFISLLSLIYAGTTKLALCLKPSSPTYSASLSPLKDITAHLSGLAHCVSLFYPSEHGATLRKEVQATAKDVFDAMRSLLQIFLRQATNDLDLSSPGLPGEEYLISSGTVHEIIEKARKGLSKNNLGAVRKKWMLDRGLLRDGLREVEKMIEDEEGDQDDELDDDCGWDELGLGVLGKKMDAMELKRTQKVHTVLRLTDILHYHILSDLLSDSPFLPPVHSLDNLLAHSSSILSASDEVIASLYAPQDSASISTELSSLIDVVRQIDNGLDEFWSMEQRMCHLSVGEQEGHPVKEKKRWFETCLRQIYNAAEALTNTRQVNVVEGPER